MQDSTSITVQLPIMENSWIPSDEVLAIVVPIAVYWAYSGVCMLLGSLDKYRLHSRKDEDDKNLVSKREVVRGVLLQQLLQASAAFLMFQMTGGDHRQKAADNDGADASSWALPVAAGQFFVGMFVLDTWQFFWHRYMHTNRFLYRHVHSWHHRLVVPYAFGSQYNHPAEGLLMDTLGGALAFLLSGMSPRTAVFFYSFATAKGIDDHCGLRLPGNVFHLLFRNDTSYHDVHHQLSGNKYNFSQPFFVTWDKIFGTYMPCGQPEKKKSN